jgi:hypothetical protein
MKSTHQRSELSAPSSQNSIEPLQIVLDMKYADGETGTFSLLWVHFMYYLLRERESVP